VELIEDLWLCRLDDLVAEVIRKYDAASECSPVHTGCCCSCPCSSPPLTADRLLVLASLLLSAVSLPEWSLPRDERIPPGGRGGWRAGSRAASLRGSEEEDKLRRKYGYIGL